MKSPSFISRRELAAALVGVGGCAATRPNQRGQTPVTALTASMREVDSIMGPGPTLSLNRISGLTAAAGGPPSLVYARGRDTQDDGGGGFFLWDATCSDPDDGGTLVRPSAGPGAWRRLFSGVMNARWFGARGDGRTDDADALQRGLDACGRESIPLHVPAGTYVLGRTLHLRASGTTVVGEPETVFAASDRVGSSEMPWLILVGTWPEEGRGPGVPAHDVTIRTLLLDANGSNRFDGAPASGLRVLGDRFMAERIRITRTLGVAKGTPASGISTAGSENHLLRCSAENCGSATQLADAFYCGAPAKGPGARNVIESCYARSCTGTAFVLETCNDSTILDCKAYACGGGAAIGSYGDETIGRRNTVRGLTVEEAGGAFGAVMVGPTSATGSVTDTSLVDLTITGTRSDGPAIWIGPPTRDCRAAVSGVLIKGVDIDWSGTGHSGIALLPGTTDVVITGGRIACDWHGISIQSGHDGARSVRCERILVQGLRMLVAQDQVGVGIGATAAGYAGPPGGCDRVIVTGCTFVPNKRRGASRFAEAVFAYAAPNSRNTAVVAFDNHVDPAEWSNAYGTGPYAADSGAIASALCVEPSKRKAGR